MIFFFVCFFLLLFVVKDEGFFCCILFIFFWSLLNLLVRFLIIIVRLFLFEFCILLIVLVIVVFKWFLCLVLLNVFNLIVNLIVLLRFVGCDCFIWICMLEFIRVFINWFLDRVFCIFKLVVGYVRFVSLWMVWVSFGSDLFGFCWCFFICILYSFVWFGGVNFFLRILISL